MRFGIVKIYSTSSKFYKFISIASMFLRFLIKISTSSINKFAITDFVIGYHTLTFFTWGSVFVIGLIAQLFKNFAMENFWCIVWSINFFCSNKFWCLGNWNVRFRSSGNKTTYLLAIPFFAYILSTLIFSLIIEVICILCIPQPKISN